MIDTFSTTSRRHRTNATLAFLSLVLASGCASTTPAPSTDASVSLPAAAAAPAVEAAPAQGRAVAGPSNLTTFSPPEIAGPVDLETLNLRNVFEELGEDATLWYQHVQTLANPYFEGRVNGSAGTDRARDYMEFYFRQYGLEPAFPVAQDEPGGAGEAAWASYRQPFDFQARGRTTVNVEGEHAALNGEALAEGEDFVVLGNGGTGDVTGPVTFVGYGIEEGPDGYTSFEDETDLTGRIALLFRYEPLSADGVSKWSPERFSPHSGIAPKMSAVKTRGAAGIILVNPPGCRDGRTGLEPISQSARFGRSLGIPVIQVTPDVAGRILAAGTAEATDLMAWRRRADEGQVKTVTLSDSALMSFGAQVERTREGGSVPADNIAAVLRGRGALADEWLFIGGHYDHNGYGMFGTTPESGPLFPGADDNASGTAGVLVLAKMLSEEYAERGADEDLRSVMFIAFDAEERGLHGSRHYADNPTVDPDKITALLNMDMIGRLRSNQLSVLGTQTARGLEDLLRPHIEESGLTVAMTPAGSGRSDDANFTRLEVPALHIFTGMHAEYTSPHNKAYTVNPIGGKRILDLLKNVAVDLVTRPDQLVFATPGADDTPTPDRGYAPVRLGIRPGMGEDLESGILVDGVSPGTSADDGGIKAGDVMLTWDDAELTDMRALVEMLRAHKPGDVVSITVMREGKKVALPVTLKAGGR